MHGRKLLVVDILEDRVARQLRERYQPLHGGHITDGRDPRGHPAAAAACIQELQDVPALKDGKFGVQLVRLESKNLFQPLYGDLAALNGHQPQDNPLVGAKPHFAQENAVQQ